MSIQLIGGDTRKKIKELSENSVHLVITSPPYGNIVNYHHIDQIGFGQTEFDYYKDLREINQHCIRVLHPGCRLIINIGDEFAAGQSSYPYHIVSHQSRIIQDILLNPEILYTGTIIWKKINGAAANKNGRILGSINIPRNGHFFVNREYILTFRKIGQGPQVTSKQKLLSKFAKKERSIWFRDTWSIPGKKQNIHPAMFPMEIPERLIRMYSFINETVLDPFCGSGTTLAAANKWGRNGIGIELGWSENWKEITLKKIDKYSK